MKITTTLALSVLLVVGVLCCKKKPNEVPDLPPGVHMEVNGQKWTADIVYPSKSIYRSCAYCGFDTSFDIIAINTSLNRQFNVSLRTWREEVNRVYNFRPYSNDYVFCDMSADTGFSNIFYDPVSSTVTITKITDTSVQGVFSAVLARDFGADTLIITNGTINVPYKRGF